MERIEYKGIQIIRYSGIKGAAEPTLVCFHGLFEGADYFEPLSKALKRNTISFSLPGHFLVDQSEGSNIIGLDQFLLSVGSFLLEQLSESFIILGHSLGGVIGSLLPTSCLRERALHFINVEGNLVASDCVLSRAISEQRVEEFTKKLQDREQGVLNASPRRFSAPGIHQLCREIVVRVDSGQVLAAYRAYSIPTTYVVGSKSANPLGLKTLGSTNAKVRHIDNAGHDLIQTHRTVIEQLLRG